MTRAYIHLNNFRSNIALLQKRSGGKPLCLAVKANAYGHGAVRIVREAEKMGVGCFGVSRISEAAELRNAGISSRILLFTISSPEEFRELWHYRIEPFVVDLAHFRRLAETLKTFTAPRASTDDPRTAPPNAANPPHAPPNAEEALRVHIKTDTGMGRIGCPPSEVRELAEAIHAHPAFILAGIATHYPLADNASDTLCGEQTAILKKLRKELKAAGINTAIHAANSGGILYHADDLDLIRPGIAAYGYPPSGLAALPSAPVSAAGLAAAPAPPASQLGEGFKPVMELRADVSFVKKVAAGTPISYGHTWTSERECWIATINVGYADGYSRRLSNTVSVLIDGRVCPQVGAICMDQCMVNLGSSPGRALGSEAILFGPDPRSESAASLARISGTISYEITCGISSRVERVYIDAGADTPKVSAAHAGADTPKVSAAHAGADTPAAASVAPAAPPAGDEQ